MAQSSASPVPKPIDLNAYRSKVSETVICYGVRVTTRPTDISRLKANLGKKNLVWVEPILFGQCCLCDSDCLEGEFVIEKRLFFRTNKSDGPSRKTVFVPRICCETCCEHERPSDRSHERSSYRTKRKCTIGEAYDMWSRDKSIGGIIADRWGSSSRPNNITSSQSGSDECEEKAAVHHKPGIPISPDCDPYADGFLVCTQLVKTGGADQGGLQVGDIFVKFGPYNKQKFAGLPSIANLVRRSADKEIPCVVLRRVEMNSSNDDDMNHRSILQKLALKLTPLQSHDADGGGVMGAVINTWPLPQMVHH